MGKFDGILLASDWDGTIYTGTEIPKNNIEAIRYFQQEGGLFTVCSGRFYPFIDSFADKIKPNTYLITLNGACIVDPVTKEFLYENTISPSFVSVLDELITNRALFKTVTVYEKVEFIAFEAKDYPNYRDSLFNNRYYKVLLVSDNENNAINAVNYINTFDKDGLVGVRSWNVSAEILDKRNTKGAAVCTVAAAVGAKRVIAVGDFENDISMLEAADLSYAVENAVPCVKAVADRVTVSVFDGAISAIIDELNKEIGDTK